ncbi:phosphatidylinositol mannoside acyltransferase [Streptoalloteichus hindustanus]|uniref:KDO2-lipid IV(A) lauroyltransferase n=1 Tax=Streptoalloteichus hindustanus TaxID=2017 RepID=A0A1M5DMJ0_STRHI|nr:phosphatidylinositol mannoside acyltransferase [Streptoalloteichus hindustanus]SHF68219.1 KDO2-lipid IV(A) lauroyltransferase [Streptoalloteichus hindustanus]
MDVRARMVEAAHAAGWQVAGALPEGLAQRIFQGAGALAARVGGRGVRQLRRNLARVRPTATADAMDELVAAAMRSYGRYWCEVFRLPSEDRSRLCEAVAARVVGREHLDVALARGAGAVLALPHMGNWDVAGVWLAARLGGFTTVVERLRPEAVYQRFVDHRRSWGFEVVPLTGGESAAVLAARRLRENRVVCLLADRDLAGDGVEVSFFGEPAHLPAGPARLAAATGAALIATAVSFTDDGGWTVTFSPPVPVCGRQDVVPATQALADTFSAAIAQRPQDWHMLQPVWDVDRVGETASAGTAPALR